MTQKSWSSVLLYYFCIKVVFMSDRIHELVDGIKEKVSLVKSQLANVNSLKDSLQNEVESLKAQLTKKGEELNHANKTVLELEAKLIANNKQDVKVKETGVSEDQIDELVKEIEYCIGQLKK